MVRDIYAKKPEPANAPDMASGMTPGAPFTLINAPGGNTKRVYFQDEESLSDRIERLTNTFYQMDMEGNPMRKPYKPYITSPHQRGRGGFSRQRGRRFGRDRNDNWNKSRGKFKGSRGGFSRRGRSSGRKFNKSPTNKRPQVSGKAVDKDKDRCYYCHQPGHFAAECLEKNKGQSQKPSEGKKFEDYTYVYSGAVEPQLATATAIPQAYEEAFVTIKNSLKHTDPLHGLNM